MWDHIQIVQNKESVMFKKPLVKGKSLNYIHPGLMSEKCKRKQFSSKSSVKTLKSPTLSQVSFTQIKSNEEILASIYKVELTRSRQVHGIRIVGNQCSGQRFCR